MTQPSPFSHGPGLKELHPSGLRPHFSPLQHRFYETHLQEKSHPEHLLFHGLRELPSPFLLPDLEPALELLKEFIQKEKRSFYLETEIVTVFPPQVYSEVF